MPLPMTKDGLLRMVLVALGAAGFAAVALTAGGVDGGGVANGASAFAAFVAVVAPQMIMVSVWFAKGGDASRAFALWAMKFSLIFLFMAVAARGLGAVSMFAAPGFVFGVACGVAGNLYMAAKMTMTAQVYNKRRGG